MADPCFNPNPDLTSHMRSPGATASPTFLLQLVMLPAFMVGDRDGMPRI